MQQPLPFSRDASRKTTATIECSKGMVGRVIGKNGDTIKALQNYTGSLIQVNQVDDPCQITISGTQQSLALAMSMVADIVRGTFKGFALLRQLAGPPLHQQHQLPRPIYAPGYGLIPSTQVRYLSRYLSRQDSRVYPPRSFLLIKTIECDIHSRRNIYYR